MRSRAAAVWLALLHGFDLAQGIFARLAKRFAGLVLKNVVKQSRGIPVAEVSERFGGMAAHRFDLAGVRQEVSYRRANIGRSDQPKSIECGNSRPFARALVPGKRDEGGFIV